MPVNFTKEKDFEREPLLEGEANFEEVEEVKKP